MLASLWSKTALSALILAIAPLYAQAADAEPASSEEQLAPYRLHHRIFHPAFERPLFAPRGLVHLRGTDGRGAPFVESAKDVQEHLNNFAASLREGAEGGESTDEVLYQFALERPGDAKENAWDISSVKACHLAKAKEEKLIVHLSPHDGTPYAIDYFISPIPHDGACPSKATKKGKSATAAQSFAFKAFQNTTVELRIGHVPPAPALRVAPQLTPQGDIKQPEPEKSFIQKYWIYMVGILIAILVAPGPEEGEGQGGGRRPTK